MVLNQVNLVGNVVRDFELRETPNGDKVANLEIILDNKNSQRKTFVSLTAWSVVGTAISKVACKGSKIFVNGRLTNDSFFDRETDKEYNKLIVTVDNFAVIG